MIVRLDNGSTTGRPSYSQTNDLNEQTVFTTFETGPRILMCYLDLTNLTQNSTIRLKVVIDGGAANFRTLDTNDGRNPYLFVVASDDDGASFGPIYVAAEVRVTIQAGGVEGAARAIPYHVVEHFLD
mgnify:CR=1 FL=1